MTTFGVVTPTLNAERFFDATLRSVWDQARGGLEVDHVVVDGGSTDRTVEIASAYASRVIVPGDDRGMYDAVNRGMEVVNGDVVGYINADDEIAPGALAIVAEAFSRHPDRGWICGRVEYVDADGQVLGRMTPIPVTLRSYLDLGWSCIPQQTVWARRTFFDAVGPFDIDYRNCGDYDWYARALKLEHPLILRQTIGRFRLHPGQISLDPAKMERENQMVRDRHGPRTWASPIRGRFLSLRLNVRNPAWLVAKKRGRISFDPDVVHQSSSE